MRFGSKQNGCYKNITLVGGNSIISVRNQPVCFHTRIRPPIGPAIFDWGPICCILIVLDGASCIMRKDDKLG